MGTNAAGGDEGSGITGHGWPPERLMEEVQGAGGAGMTYQLGGKFHCRTSERTVSEIKRVFGGAPPGSGTKCCVSRTRYSTCQVIAPTMQVGERISWMG